MEEMIGLILVTFFMEFIFWSLVYGTGYLLTPIVSIGKWSPDSLIKNKKTRKTTKGQSGVKLIDRSGKTYLGAWGVSLLGLCFWVIVILFIII